MSPGFKDTDEKRLVVKPAQLGDAPDVQVAGPQERTGPLDALALYEMYGAHAGHTAEEFTKLTLAQTKLGRQVPNHQFRVGDPLLDHLQRGQKAQQLRSS